MAICDFPAQISLHIYDNLWIKETLENSLEGVAAFPWAATSSYQRTIQASSQGFSCLAMRRLRQCEAKIETI